jgi:hypothetical protein
MICEPMLRNPIRSFRWALLFGLAVTACGGSAPDAAVPLAVPPAESAPNDESPTDKIRWRDASNGLLLELKPRDGGYTLADGADVKIGSIKVEADRVKLEDAEGVELAKVKMKEDGGVELEDASGNRLYRIKLDPDGSFRVRNASDETVYKAKLKDDGYEVRDASGATLAKAKARDGKVNFKTEEGESLGELKGTENARAAMWLALDGLPPRQRAAIVAFFLAVYQ